MAHLTAAAAPTFATRAGFVKAGWDNPGTRGVKGSQREAIHSFAPTPFADIISTWESPFTQRGLSAIPNVTFLGEIRHGEIHTEQPLANFEGEKVSVTVIAQEAASLAESSEAKDCPPPEQPFNPEEPVILQDIGRVRMPPQDVRTLKARIIDVGRLAPRVYTSDEEG